MIQQTTGRRGIRLCTILLFCHLFLCYPPATNAHELFSTFIQHTLRLSVDARYVDLTVELTFFESWSTRERRIMDADGDGRITKAELKAYLKIIAPVVADQVRLKLEEQDLPLALLYDPEADLLGNWRTTPSHHRLQLHFFAARPAQLSNNSNLVIEDRLWPEARALASIAAEGHDGAAFDVEPLEDPALNELRPTQAHQFKIRCLKPPATVLATKPPTYRRPPEAADRPPPHRLTPIQNP